jgi:hypothetical protein
MVNRRMDGMNYINHGAPVKMITPNHLEWDGNVHQE